MAGSGALGEHRCIACYQLRVLSFDPPLHCSGQAGLLGLTSMIKRICLISFAFVVLFAASEPTQSQTNPSAEIVMQKVARKLAAVKQLGYKYTFTYAYPSKDKRTVVTSQAFFDLQPADRKGGFKFQFNGEGRLSVYNGSERFITDEKTKKLYVESNPSFDRVGDIVLLNSPLTLKNALPKIAEDRKVKKELLTVTVNGRQYYVLEFTLPKAALNADGSIFQSRADQNAIYRVTVNTRTFLPVEVKQTNDKNDEALQTFFADVTEKPIVPKRQSWYFSTYTPEYRLEKKEKLTLVEAGKTSPDFKLASYGSPGQVSLDQYKGKLVLLEFWITYCGFCIAAVPKINAISQRFRDKDLRVISINMHDPAVTIDFFKSKNKPEYIILTGGESIAKAYGVEAYPAFVL